MRRRLFGLVCALALFVGLLPVPALALEGVYVALGDSIADGYGLAEDEQAFPELVAAERGYELKTVTSSEGMTSADLLAQLSDKNVAAQVASADVITITVGGNDLMDALYDYLAAQSGGLLTAETIEAMLTGAGGEIELGNSVVSLVMGKLAGFPTSEQAASAIKALGTNLAGMVQAIKAANPDVTIVITNQYNPYGHLDDAAVEAVVSAFDQGVQTLNAALQNLATPAGVPVADVYALFDASEAAPCNAWVEGTKANLDFHPNALGHKLIAQAVEAKLPDPEPTPDPEPGPNWTEVALEVAGAEPGATVTVDMDGTTEVPAAALAALAGRDVTVRLEIGAGVAWEIDGADVPKDAELSGIDLGIELNTTGIPSNLVGLVSGTLGSLQATLSHDGAFGFDVTLAVSLDKALAGAFANAYSYDEVKQGLRFEGAATVGADGSARLTIDHASQWLVALDTKSHALPFGDTLEGEGYSEAVRWAWLSGTMGGYADGSGLFGTDGVLTRSQMAAVLYNLAGKPEVPVVSMPGDCDPNEWYARAVTWSLAARVFNGYDDGSGFGPENSLTREQAACVLKNAAGMLGLDTSARADLSAYPDAGNVSSWATNALSWAVGSGVLNGVDVGDGVRELQPGRACTRTEMAALLMNLAARG